MQSHTNRRTKQNFLQDGLLQIILANSLILLLTSSTLERLEIENLFFHIMIEHLLYLSIGFLNASGFDSIIKSFKSSSSNYRLKILKYYSNYLAINNRLNPFGLITGLLFLIILFYWHIPSNFDSAIVNFDTHIFMHFSIILSGIFLYSSFKMISRIQSLVFILAIDKTMGILGFFLAGGSSQIYQTYPLSVQMTSGFWMILMMVGIDLLCIILILKNFFNSTDK
ncbi:MAG: hypothetical protein CMO19_01695 [Thaumarchaeota archaeon]|nr:hypothetical protein [Nitrososphaerota archaeon]|tara:strand:+ start:12833 stop:13507 length:675 start_codon:yes stop_codon:yes gene_type:complete